MSDFSLLDAAFPIALISARMGDCEHDNLRFRNLINDRIRESFEGEITNFADNARRFLAGEPLNALVDRVRGY